MPEFDPKKLGADMIIACAYVRSVMFFPKDELERKETQDALASDLLSEKFAAAGNLLVPARVASTLRKAPTIRDLGGKGGLRTIIREAWTVGRAFGTIMRAAEHGHPELASVGAVRRAILRCGPGAPSEKTLKKWWYRYSCVAHLWAWSQHLFRQREDTRPEMLRFLAAAEDLRRRGEAYVPLGAHKPVLVASETWKVPAEFSLPAATDQLPPPTDGDLLFISSGKSQQG